MAFHLTYHPAALLKTVKHSNRRSCNVGIPNGVFGGEESIATVTEASRSRGWEKGLV